MAVGPFYTILEGAGLITEIVSIQAVQGVIASSVLWIALWRHGGLLAAPLGNTAAVLCGISWLSLKKRRGIWDLLTFHGKQGSDSGAAIDWKKEIWPFQWKIAVSGISGYFIFQLFNPILFAAHGAAAAGRMGLCITVVTAIGTISLGWITTKSATFGMLIAREDYEHLDRLFFPCLWQSLTLVTIGGMSFWTAAYYLHHLHNRLSQRILDPLPLGLLVVTMIINQVIAAQALYLRAHKQEPLLWLSVIGAVCISLLSFLLAKPFGATGLMFGYFLVTLVVGLGGGTWVFVHKRKEWHRGLPPLPQPLAS
jgi:O-antigen/teichoic acid export membrane protein